LLLLRLTKPIEPNDESGRCKKKVDGKWLRDGQSYNTKEKERKGEREKNERRWVGRENPLICSRNEGGREWKEVRRETEQGTGPQADTNTSCSRVALSSNGRLSFLKK